MSKFTNPQLARFKSVPLSRFEEKHCIA